MAYNGGDRLNRTLIADVALDAYAGVSYQSTVARGTIAASGGNTFAGIVTEKVSSGQHASVCYFGEIKAKASAAIAINAGVGIDNASGFLTAIASGSAGDKFMVGRARTTAASGMLFTVMITGLPMHLNSGAAV